MILDERRASGSECLLSGLQDCSPPSGPALSRGEQTRTRTNLRGCHLRATVVKGSTPGAAAETPRCQACHAAAADLHRSWRGSTDQGEEGWQEGAPERGAGLPVQQGQR